ncbi:MAG: FtsX-like permease family protein [Gemmatimonadetes bacterium]|nr:FtsX-like permease family protein [Gemmatimonadota bacterium]
MSRGPGRLERLLLRGFAPEDAADIMADLRELAARRGPVRGRIYYWTELAKYPVRRTLDGIRAGGRSPIHDGNGEGGVESILRDTRYALRGLIRNPGFSGMAIAIMTISIGAVAAIFGVVQGVLLDPLPVHRPDRLFAVWIDNSERGLGRMTPGNFRDIAELDRALEYVAAFSEQTTSIDLGDRPVFLRGSRVTPGYFETLGVDLALGRGFTADDGERGGPSVVVLGHRLWTEAFAADPEVVGRSVRLDGTEFDVVGVASPGVYPTHATVSAELPFSASNQDFFVPLRYSPEGWANRRSHVLGMIARVGDDASVDVAEQRLEALAANLRATEPLNQNDSFLLSPFTEEVVGDVRFALVMLLGTSGLVLLIALVNVGALFTLRAEDRRPEIAVRVAMGAPRSRLVRLLLLESAIVTAISSVGAIVVARGALGIMRGLVPYQIPRLESVTLDGTVFGVSIVVAALATAVFALAPAAGLQLGRLAGVAGRSTDGPGRRRVQSAVVALQAALGVVVLVGAVLLTRSYVNLRAVDPGFDALDAWTMTVPGSADVLDLVVERIRELPGVEGAARAYDHPFSRSWGDGFGIVGRTPDPNGPPMPASLRPYGPDYLQTVGLRVVEGRLPDRVDLSGEVGYAVVNQTLAEAFFPDTSPLGQRIELPTAQRMFGSEGLFEIAAVVEDVRFFGPGRPAGPALYVPITHFPVTATSLVVRPTRADLDVLTGIRGVVAEIDAGLGLQAARPLRDVLHEMLARPRFNMMLLVALALVALLLSGLGAYGLMARAVSRRVREIGIQMTLGADRAHLASVVMRAALWPMAVGVIVGGVVAFASARVLQSVLFGVTPTDPASFLAGAAFVLGVGVIAALGPVLRAVSIDPATALRSE